MELTEQQHNILIDIITLIAKHRYSADDKESQDLIEMRMLMLDTQVKLCALRGDSFEETISALLRHKS